jgi:predicted permease
MKTFWLEIKQSASSLKASPGFTVCVVFTLALALGALISMYSINTMMFVKPLPYQDQDRLVVVQQQLIQNGEVRLTSQTFPALMMWHEQQTQFEETALVGYYDQPLTSHNEQPKIKTTFTTPGYFKLTNAPLAIGRTLEQSEDVDTHQPVAVISYQMWQQFYHNDPDILSTTVNINDINYRVIGVTAANFYEPRLNGSDRATQVWLPWDFNPDTEKQFWGRYYPHHQFIGKIKTTSSALAANHELSEIIKQGFEENASHEPYFQGYSIDSNLVLMESVILGDSASMALVLLSAAIGLLLIASANVANLLMARTAKNHHQFAIRSALGAKSKHLLRLMFAQTLCLLMPATLLAVGLASLSLNVLKQLASEHLPRIAELNIDLNIILFAIVTMLVMSFIFAFIASKTINAARLQQSLQSGGKGTVANVSGKIRGLLIASQVAIAAVLISANLDLFMQANQKINQSLGFNEQQLYSVQITTGKANFNMAQRVELINTIKREMGELPYIESISTSSAQPLDISRTTNVHINDRNQSIDGRFIFADERFLSTIGVSFIDGRNFTLQEVQDQASLIILSQSLATSLYPKGNAVGNSLIFTSSDDPKPYKIIGIVNNINDPTEATTRTGYTAYPGYSLHFMIRVKLKQSIKKSQLIKELSAINKQINIDELTKMTDSHQYKLARDKTTAKFATAITLLSLLLASIGLYGILSYNINLRRHEIGVRLAIGAKGSHIIRLLIKQNTLPMIIGLLTGLGIALVIIALFGEAFTQYFTFNPYALLVALILLVITAIAACYLPLRPLLTARPINVLKG